MRVLFLAQPLSLADDCGAAVRTGAQHHVRVLLHVTGEVRNDLKTEAVRPAFDRHGVMRRVRPEVTRLLPLPVLDGGHVVFLGLEALRRGKPVSLKIRIVANNVGVAMLVLFMVVVTFYDVRKIFGL